MKTVSRSLVLLLVAALAVGSGAIEAENKNKGAKIGAISGLALGARAAYSRTDDRRAVTVSASANGQIINTGVDFTLDTRLANTQSAGLSQNTLRTRVAARKSFNVTVATSVSMVPCKRNRPVEKERNILGVLLQIR